MTNDSQNSSYQTNQEIISENEIYSDSRSSPDSKTRDSGEVGEALDFNNPDYSFIPKGYHEWRQRGPYCICTSCELEHAIYLGMDKLLIGIDEKGQPIVKKKV